MIVSADPFALVFRDTAAPMVRAMEEIRRNDYLWDQVTHRQDYPGSAHVMTKAIFLRWATEWTIPCIFESLSAEWCDASAILTQTTALVRTVLESVGATELGRVLIAKLPDGGYIRQHSDEGLYAHHFDRFHVPLESARGNRFHVDDACVEMDVGECWWFNHELPHYATNSSGQDRVHLIIDCVAPAYRAMRRGF